jgi:hypothetical protein
MPESDVPSSNRARSKPQQETRKRVSTTDQGQTSAGPSAGMQEPQYSGESLLGSDFSQETFERHAELLGDSRLSSPANAVVRMQIAQKLQRDYGNQYVQRLVKHNTRASADASAEGSPPVSTGRWVSPLREEETSRQSESGQLTAEELIKQFTNFGGLNLKEEPLAKDLLNRMPDQSDLVFQVFRKLDRVDRDDVAYYMLKNSSDQTINDIATAPAWSQIQIMILGEISDGWATGDEKEQRTRLMNAKSPVEPPQEGQSKGNNETDTSKAIELIKKHTSLLNLRETELAKDLLGRLPGAVTLANQVLDELGYTDKDDVSLELLNEASDDQIKSIAADAGGRAVLLRMVQEMFLGNMGGDEREQMQRTMKLITAVDRAKRESGEGDTSGDTLTVEVITWLEGSLDAIGVALGGKKGHTLIVINDELVYSFEFGWSCGRTKGEYLAENTGRDGVGQVLDLPAEEVNKIQDHLNNSCGSGMYAISGDICTDSAAKALETVLKGLKSGWNPNLFIGQIEDAVEVRSRNTYPKK